MNMQTWYECKVKYLKIDQGGFERNVSDNYLIDAVSYTDAESRVFEIMKEITRGDFQVMNIKRSNVSEVISKNDGEWWFKAKINMVTIDEEAGKEKKATNYFLIMANDLKDAFHQLEEGLSYMLVPYVTTAIQLSTIAEVFPYIPADQIKPKPVAYSPVVAEETEEEIFEETFGEDDVDEDDVDEDDSEDDAEENIEE
jgi:hypothetical protein